MSRTDLESLLRLASEATGCTVEELVSPDQHSTLVHARRLFVAAARRKGFSYPEIGRALHRHHSTIIRLTRTTGHYEKILAQMPDETTRGPENG
jgi:chromosomal replication initiation ATPase DnaA